MENVGEDIKTEFSLTPAGRLENKAFALLDEYHALVAAHEKLFADCYSITDDKGGTRYVYIYPTEYLWMGRPKNRPLLDNIFKVLTDARKAAKKAGDTVKSAELEKAISSIFMPYGDFHSDWKYHGQDTFQTLNGYWMVTSKLPETAVQEHAVSAIAVVNAEIEAATNPTPAEEEAKPISKMSSDEREKYARIQRWRRELKKTYKNKPSIFDFPTGEYGTAEYLENKARELGQDCLNLEKLHEELFADPWNYREQVVYVYPNKQLWEDRPKKEQIDSILFPFFMAALEKYEEAGNKKKADEMSGLASLHSSLGRRMGSYERYLAPPGAKTKHPDDKTIDIAYPGAVPCRTTSERCAIQGGGKKSKSKYSRKSKSKSKKLKSKKSKSKKSKSKKSKYSRKY